MNEENNIIFANLYKKLQSYLNTSGENENIYIITPFINENILKSLLKEKSNVIIITSWREDHLLTGVSSIELFDIAEKKDWTLYVNNKLHFKFYSKSLESGFIGSPNITQQALKGDNEEGMIFLEKLNRLDRIFILKIIQDSTLVTKEVYEGYKKWLNKQEFVDISTSNKIDISDMKRDKYFLTTHLPASKSPTRLWNIIKNKNGKYESWEIEAMEHDLALYDINNFNKREKFLEELKKGFFNHPFIEALINEIDKEGLRFGGVKEWIQHNCTDVPRPYRKELNDVVKNLYKWFVELGGDEYEIIRPNYTEIIRKKKEE